MKQKIIDILTYIATRASETVVYGEHWGAKFCHEEICEGIDNAMTAIKEELDWDSLTDEECKSLRFGKWGKDSPVRLIPLWLYKAIPIGTKLISINGDERVFDGSNIDTDIRFGCLAWGIIPKDKRESWQ